MKLTFIGAAHEVTGSCTLLENAGRRLFIDCGMEQGADSFENTLPPYPANQIDFVVLTHAHIDHTGNLPLLYKNGFRGVVYATKETCSLCDIMLRDCAHIQMSEAEYKSRKARRAGEAEVEPVYDMGDVEGVLKLLRPCDYGQQVALDENIRIRFNDMGHLLGSASVELWLQENGVEKKLVCSGDVGNTDQPILRDPQPVKDADYLLIESTYGNRLHEKGHSHRQTVQALADVLQRTLDRGGNVIIPSFAVGRTQEILYFIREIKNSRMIHGHDGFPVYVDSPLANEATSVFLQCDTACLDEDARAVMAAGENPLYFQGLHTYVSTEQSKELNLDPAPKVIISSSGMCEAGRIRHHLKYNLWRKECTILFVGYQAGRTLGRLLYDGEKSVRLFGDEVAVNAEIALLPGISGHADRDGLLHWVEQFVQKPTQIFVNHGDDEACTEFSAALTARFGVPAYAPFSGTEYDLAAGEFTLQTGGVPSKDKKLAARTTAKRTAFDRLLAAARRLADVAAACEGMANKDLARFCSQIESLCDRWKR